MTEEDIICQKLEIYLIKKNYSVFCSKSVRSGAANVIIFNNIGLKLENYVKGKLR